MGQIGLKFVKMGPGGSGWAQVVQIGPWWVSLVYWHPYRVKALVVGVLILTLVTTGRAEQ